MKILVISDFDNLPLHIANSFEDLAETQLLTTRNLENSISTNISDYSDRVTWLKNAIRSFIYRRVILKVNNRYSFFQDINENKDYYSLKKIVKKAKFIPDVIIVVFDYRIVTTHTIKELHKWSKAKIFWMIPDMKPMTGGCSYAAKCLGYEKSCSLCPAIGTSLMKNFANQTLIKKINNLQNVNLTVITGSTFQYNQAKQSSVFRGKEIHKIYFPSNEGIFRYKDIQEARVELGISTSKKIVLIGSTSLFEERKGMKYVLEALQKLPTHDKDKTLLLIVGNGDSEELKTLNIQSVNLGYVDYKKLALAYQAADVFVCPTIDDSGPIMVSQSVMCGTPVVSFKMGISIDLVENDKTGYICELENSGQLSIGISKIINANMQQTIALQENCIARSRDLNFKNFQARFRELIIDGNDKN